MSRDYKPAPQRNSESKGSPFISGMLIGFLMGIGVSLAVTLVIKGEGSPFTKNDTQAALIQPTKEPIAESEKPATEDALPKDENPKPTAPTAAEEQKHFDFYTILPGSETNVTEKEIKDTAATIKKDNYFLQAGAFQKEADADNMKAKLALQGFEAVVQTADIPEKGIWHRVRVGPLTDIDQINKTRAALVSSGFSADLIKIHSETPPQ
ncbi:MAG: SPOR domain-containing protein [Methylophilaceae bacterium]|nr:SPOR domain-containing protein [Methylophilaceae bacterium]